MVKIIVMNVILAIHFFSPFHQDPMLQESMKRGKVVYDDFCVTCHRSNGKGFGKLYPPLAESDFLVKNRNQSIRAVKYGMEGEIEVNGQRYNKKMAPLGLSDEEVVDVINYIFNSWGNVSDTLVTLEKVVSITQEN
ncbi:MAG: cytochrome c [Saprospiraceae bacterium]